MKIKANLHKSNSSLLDETLIALTKAEEQIVEKVTNQFKKEIINELNLSSLDETKKQKMIQGIKIEKVSPSEWILIINNEEVRTIEFGTSERDEEPFLLRAKLKAEANLNNIIKTELNHSFRQTKKD